MLRMATMALAVAGGFLASVTTGAQAQDVTAAEARAIAKEAYVYGFPMVDSYRIQYAYFVDTKNPEYKAPWNQLNNIPRVYTPADTAIQTPNSDTPYSMIGMDLRAEPIVLTVPVIEKDRYFSIQLIDAYTFNFDYAGSRTTGNDGGSFLVAGPGWKGETPEPASRRCFARRPISCIGAYRTQLFNPGRPRQREEDPGGLQGRAAFGIPRPDRACRRAGNRLHQAAFGGGRAEIARVLQHPEFRPAVLPDQSVRDRADGAFRQDRGRRGQDLRCEHAARPTSRPLSSKGWPTPGSISRI